jgi:hypothetical protein
MSKTPTRKQQIDDLMASLFPDWPGTINEVTLRAAIEQAMEIAEAHTLASLLDIEQALAAVNQRLLNAGRPAISRRRLQAIARVQHDRYGVGYNATGANAWLFRPSEIEKLVPGKAGRPRKSVKIKEKVTQ